MCEMKGWSEMKGLVWFRGMEGCGEGGKVSPALLLQSS